ncbi:hypothetical protein ACFCYB_00445 [Streptomyces sp. NPDC056309]|uniref:hypothetical protein n=1 Tax=Streptomyces sp. NPDC056309 TaxID=3345781 RepID=UPI0035DF9F60
MFGLITRRRHEQELTEVRARADQFRAERDDARTERDAFRAAQQIAARQYDEVEAKRRRLAGWLAEADAANRRLKGRVLELGRRNNALGESDPEYAASLERRIGRLKRVGIRILAAYRAEKHRADRLQDQLDDALGLNDPRVDNGQHWQHTRNDRQTRKEPTS